MTWQNVQDGCPLCVMEEKTYWYHEDENVVIADALGTGEPFVVWKEHTKSITPDERTIVHETVADVFGSHGLVAKMNVVEDHWHAHITGIDASQAELTDE